MFFSTAADQLIPGPKIPATIRNALLESFTVHARSILFFFYPSNPKPDDALAEDFLVSGKTWNKLRPSMPPELCKLQKRVGKEIAHLTYARADVTAEHKGWNFGKIILEFVPVFQVFAANSDSQKLHNHFLEVGDRWIRLFVERGVFTLIL